MKAATREHEEHEQEHRFQSTPPVKAATWDAYEFKVDGTISIHAAREGGDSGNE